MKWFRQWKARLYSHFTPEYGGMLWNYKNGEYEEISTWDGMGGYKEVEAIIESLFSGARDEVYFIVIKQGASKGYFMALTSNREMYHRAFWDGVYHPNEAMLDVSRWCRKKADEMGFVERKDENS